MNLSLVAAHELQRLRVLWELTTLALKLRLEWEFPRTFHLLYDTWTIGSRALKKAQPTFPHALTPYTVLLSLKIWSASLLSAQPGYLNSKYVLLAPTSLLFLYGQS